MFNQLMKEHKERERILDKYRTSIDLKTMNLKKYHVRIDYDSFADLTLVIGEKKFPVHKLILMNNTTYFNSYLNYYKEDVIEIEYDDVDLFEKILELIYHHYTSVYDLDILKLILLIQFFGVKGVNIDEIVAQVYINPNEYDEYVELLDLIYPSGSSIKDILIINENRHKESIDYLKIQRSDDPMELSDLSYMPTFKAFDHPRLYKDSNTKLLDYSYKSSDHPRLYGIYVNLKSFSDLKILVGSTVFDVHKLILINASHYFASILLNHDIIEIDENSNVFDRLLNLIYGESIELYGRDDRKSKIIEWKFNRTISRISDDFEALEMIRLIKVYGIKGIDVDQLMIDVELHPKRLIYSNYLNLLNEVYPEEIPSSIKQIIKEKVDKLRSEFDTNKID